MEENSEDGENRKKKGMRDFAEKHPFSAAVLLSVISGVALAAILQMGMFTGSFPEAYRLGGFLELFSAVLAGAFIYGGFMIFPLVLTGAEIYLLIKGQKNRELYRKGRIFDIAGILLGMFYSVLYLSFANEVMFEKDWMEQLVNRQTHTPIYTGSQLTMAVTALAAVAGYLTVNYVSLNKMPPLITVLGMAAMYLGTTESILWGIQVFREPFLDIYLLLLPLNCLLITGRTVSRKMWEWGRIMEEDEARKERYQEGKGIFSACNRLLSKAERWPLAAFFLMWPLLGILIGFLILFGQRPDAVIKAFTETSDWNLSQRVAPQNIYYDEHYLCTVAAGGHEKIVKPKRLGVRHGHQVIVNRQLCVANAFEQVLEERTPGFHRAVRHFYDTFGFPVARLIHSKYMADLIYFLMKPLEWIFLIILYLTDADPESRIAIQYTGKSLADFERVS